VRHKHLISSCCSAAQGFSLLAFALLITLFFHFQ